jgi:hypothetical protein
MNLSDTVTRRAAAENLAELFPVVADALMAGRLGAWLVPDATERVDVLRRYARFSLAGGLAHGQVDMTADRSAVAVWYVRPKPPLPAAEYRYDLRRLLGTHAARIELLHAYLEAACPHTPHHYLAHLAFRPGRGAAAKALVASHHRHLDAEALPAYADVIADQPREGLLAHLGYQLRSPILLEPGGPVLWRMVRPGLAGDQPDGLPRRIRLHPTATPLTGRVMPAASPPTP